MEKPRGPSDQYCPQWRQKMSKVCHTCHWWQSMPVDDGKGGVRDIYGCAVVLQLALQRDTVIAARGAQKAHESWRNEIVSIAQQQQEAHATALKLADKSAVRELQAQSKMKLIEGTGG